MEHLETKRNVERERRKVEDIKFLSPPCAHALARAGSARYGHGHEHRTLLARTFSLHIGVEDIVIHISYRPFTHDITINHTRKRHSNERFWLQDPKAPHFVRLVSCIKTRSGPKIPAVGPFGGGFLFGLDMFSWSICPTCSISGL